MVACPHCGGPVCIATAAEAKAQGSPRERIERGQRLRAPACTVRDAAPCCGRCLAGQEDSRPELSSSPGLLVDV